MTQENKTRSMIARIVAVVVALAVIGGSIFAFACPGLNKSASSWLPSAYADEWKILKKGSSGAPAASQALTRDDIQAILESTFCDSILLCWKREETSDTINLKGGEAP